MNIHALRSDAIYQKIMAAPMEKKTDIYRYEMMMPFEKKWACYNVPMKAQVPGGYDVIMAGGMLGYLEPTKVDASQKGAIERIASERLWAACQGSLERSLACFAQAGIELPTREYLYTILLAEPTTPYIALCDGYSGDGGIPGYITLVLVPQENTIRRLPACLAHEANHNVRFQFIQWKNDITLGEMIVSEGLAENFATQLFGEELVGPWVSRTDERTLREVIKPTLLHNLGVQGMDNLNAYLYGDEMAALQGFASVGVPYCAGYACGYHLVKHYLQKTGKSIVEATILPAQEILDAAREFWVG